MFVKNSLLILTLLIFNQVHGVCVQPVNGQPFKDGLQPNRIAFSPVINGKLFSSITDFGNNAINTYQVDTSKGLSSGAFTQISAPLSTGIAPVGVAYSPIVNNNLFVGVANSSSNTVTMYLANTETGVLAPIGSFAGNGSPINIAFSPVINGNLFAAITNGVQTQNLVTVYSVNTITGALTPVAGSPFSSSSTPLSIPWGIAFSPLINGNLFAAVTNLGNSISVFSVNTTTGFFTLIETIPLTGTMGPVSIAFSPLVNGNLFALIPNSNDNTVLLFQVNTTTGSFTHISTAPAGSLPGTVAFSPFVNDILLSGVFNQGDGSISVYSVNTSTGSLNQLLGSPFPTASGGFGFDFSPFINGHVFFAAGNFDSSSISVYKVSYAPLLISAILNCATRTITVQGRADANAIITVIADGTNMIGSGFTDSFGNFNIIVVLPIATTIRTITATQTIGTCTTEQSNSILLMSDLTSAIKQKYCSF